MSLFHDDNDAVAALLMDLISNHRFTWTGLGIAVCDSPESGKPIISLGQVDGRLYRISVGDTTGWVQFNKDQWRRIRELVLDYDIGPRQSGVLYRAIEDTYERENLCW